MEQQWNTNMFIVFSTENRNLIWWPHPDLRWKLSNIFFSKHTSKTFDDSGGFCRCCCLLLVVCCLLVVFFSTAQPAAGFDPWTVHINDVCSGLAAVWHVFERQGPTTKGMGKNTAMMSFRVFSNSLFFFFFGCQFLPPKTSFFGGHEQQAADFSKRWFFKKNHRFAKDGSFSLTGMAPCQEANL